MLKGRIMSGRSTISSVQFKMEKSICGPLPCLSLRSFPHVALETVPMLARLTMALSRPFKERQPSASSFCAQSYNSRKRKSDSTYTSVTYHYMLQKGLVNTTEAGRGKTERRGPEPVAASEACKSTF